MQSRFEPGWSTAGTTRLGNQRETFLLRKLLRGEFNRVELPLLTGDEIFRARADVARYFTQQNR
jgi:hypothetical protein